MNLLYEYCSTWKLKVNVAKTKVMIFKKGEILNFCMMARLLQVLILRNYFYYGGSLTSAQEMLSEKALKAMFKLDKFMYLYLYKFTYISPKVKLELFDQFVFQTVFLIKRFTCNFVKKNLLGVKKDS